MLPSDSPSSGRPWPHPQPHALHLHRCHPHLHPSPHVLVIIITTTTTAFDHSDVHQGITDPAPKDMPDVAFISLAEAGPFVGALGVAAVIRTTWAGSTFGTGSGNIYRGHGNRRQEAGLRGPADAR